MMKKILAVAIASAFAAPAFAATANVDVYGSINLSVEHVDNGDESWNRMVTNNNSFLGFKGAEDLGGGMKAVWQLETNVSFDGNASAPSSTTADGTNGNLFGTRNTYVGLAGGFGTVIGGVHDTPYKMATGPLDIFVGTLGDHNSVFGAAGMMGSNPSALFDLRTGNTIAYLSPNFGGFDVKAAYVMGLEGAEDALTTTDRSSAYSLSGTYKNGPLFATAAYEKHNKANTTACNAGATCLGQGAIDRKAWKIGVGYTIAGFKLGAVYEKMDSDDFQVPGSLTAAGLATGVDHSSWMLNAAYTMGAFTLKGSYTRAGDVGDIDDSGAKMYVLGADYALSKRTVVQLTYAKMNNDDFGGWALGQGPQVASVSTGLIPGVGTFNAGEDPTGFSLGLKHTF